VFWRGAAEREEVLQKKIIFQKLRVSRLRERKKETAESTTELKKKTYHLLEKKLPPFTTV